MAAPRAQRSYFLSQFLPVAPAPAVQLLPSVNLLGKQPPGKEIAPVMEAGAFTAFAAAATATVLVVALRLKAWLLAAGTRPPPSTQACVHSL